MDNQARNELSVKLNDFYIKNVHKRIDDFNLARQIANTSKKICLKSVIFLVIGVSIVMLSISFMPGLCVLLIPMFMFYNVVYGKMAELYKMDKKNIIHVFTPKENSITIPLSADEEIKKFLMPKFLKIFGDFTWSKGYNGKNFWKSIKYIKTLKILNNPITNFDDCISGVYKGINMKIFDANTSVLKLEYIAIIVVILFVIIATFKMLSLIFLLPVIIIFGIVHLTSKGFNGVVVEMDMNKNFEGQIFIFEKNNLKDKMSINKGKYTEVNLEDIEFKKDFCVYSDNQIEARYLLTTTFIERLKNIKLVYKAKYVRAVLKDAKIILLIHTGKDMFQMAGDEPMRKETFIELFDEIISVFELVDILKLNEKLGL